jgi:hypothetical protein
MTDEFPRTPFSWFRSGVPERDERSRAHAQARLETHIAERSRQRPSSPPFLRRRPPRRLAGPLAAAFVVVGAGVAVASGFWRTEHTAHLPVFTPAGKLSSAFHVGTRASGSCWTASLASGAADAWRCAAGNAIHDPCFAASPHAKTVVCFLDPWHPVTILALTKPLPRHGPTLAQTLPWAIETTDGRRCTYLTGATAPMGAERINYGCTDHSYLIGSPNRSTPLWTIRSSRTYRPDRPGHPTPLADFPLAQIRRTIS